ncbi:glycosyltransferase family 4 protein [Clostridium sp.]|uniref:glycosyltransferase family 4 protein n=1 Tax=Clostridium sp. TaxID=1506 RepID=UPI00321736AA
MEKFNDKKTILIATGYPSYENKYNLAFIHTRVKNYKNNVDVYVISDEEYDDCFEGVNVYYRNIHNIVHEVEKSENILIHFMGYRLLGEFVKQNIHSKNVIIWVHGTEALSGWRRLFNLKVDGLLKFVRYFLWSFKNRVLINKNLRRIKKNNKVSFVFPSIWMKEIAEKDLYMKVDKFKIIPNPVDTELFKRDKNEVEYRYNILSIRSYRTYKYAVDILEDIIIAFINDKRFYEIKDKINITIYGDGKLFEKNTQLLKKHKCIKLNKMFLTQKEMSQVFNKNGIFINTTRQDAQGVTMCEAMSSGLVTLNSNNTAIPEFVCKGNGILCDNIKSFVDALYETIDNKEKYIEISKNASKHVRKTLSVDKICKEELDFINELY